MNIKERNENMREFFNDRAHTYDDVHKKFMETKKDLIENVPKDKTKILDLGAGTGLELTYLFQMNPNAEVTAIDISEKMLEKLKEREFGKKINIISGDFFEVDFKGPYDAVISTSALHHFPKEDKIRLYKKIINCLKDNGEFINSDKVASSIEEEKQLLDDYYKFKDEKPHCDTPLSCETERDLLESIGFKEVTIKETKTENYRLIKAKK